MEYNDPTSDAFLENEVNQFARNEKSEKKVHAHLTKRMISCIIKTGPTLDLNWRSSHMPQSRKNNLSQQMRIRYYIMNLIYHSYGKSVQVPSTRELAKQFGIARSTIQLAFEKLLQEGYLICRQGAPTMTNPLSQFVLQPQTRNPLIGIKLYEGDAFYYGSNFWRSLSCIATELTERNYNIRLLMNPTITRESIEQDIRESYLDGVILIHTTQEYAQAAARLNLPCVMIDYQPHPDLPAVLLKSSESAIRRLSRKLHTENRKYGLDIVNSFYTDSNALFLKQTLEELDPELQIQSVSLENMNLNSGRHPVDFILHYEQQAELLQKLVDESGRDILLISRKRPVKSLYYRGCYFEFPLEQLGRVAVDLLEKRIAGKECPRQTVVEAELLQKE